MVAVGHKAPDRKEPAQVVVAQSSRVEDMASFGQGKEDLVEVQIENAALVAAVRKADDAEVDSLVAEGMVNLLRQHCQLVLHAGQDTQPRLDARSIFLLSLTGLTVRSWRRTLIVVAHDRRFAINCVCATCSRRILSDSCFRCNLAAQRINKASLDTLPQVVQGYAVARNNCASEGL